MPYRVVVLRAARDQFRGAPPILQGYVDGILAMLRVDPSAATAAFEVRVVDDDYREVDPARNRLAATVEVPGGLGAGAGSVLVAGAWCWSPTRATARSASSTATGSPMASSTPPDATW